jgi:hypothetical protein
MSRTAKVLLLSLGVLFALGFNATLVAGIIVYRGARSGIAVVSVHEKRPGGTSLSLPVPVGLIHAALRFADFDDHGSLDPEVKRLWPVARAALAEIEAAPDCVLVEVRSPDEHVVIRKQDGRIVVDVDSREEQVHVALPSDALGDLLDAVASRAEARTRTEARRHPREEI